MQKFKDLKKTETNPCLLHHDNRICLTGEPGDVLSPNPKVVGIMSTYEEFMVLLTMGLLIVAILNLKNKK